MNCCTDGYLGIIFNWCAIEYAERLLRLTALSWRQRSHIVGSCRLEVGSQSKRDASGGGLK